MATALEASALRANEKGPASRQPFLSSDQGRRCSQRLSDYDFLAFFLDFFAMIASSGSDDRQIGVLV
jgi:hypothetical protein